LRQRAAVPVHVVVAVKVHVNVNVNVNVESLGDVDPVELPPAALGRCS
jgi:hypothetical protein